MGDIFSSEVFMPPLQGYIICAIQFRRASPFADILRPFRAVLIKGVFTCKIENGLQILLLKIARLQIRQSVGEIKWSNRFFEKPYELKSLIKFCKENNLKDTLVTTIDKRDVKNIEGIEIEFIPAGLYAYILGENALGFGINPAKAG